MVWSEVSQDQEVSARILCGFTRTSRTSQDLRLLHSPRAYHGITTDFRGLWLGRARVWLETVDPSHAKASTCIGCRCGHAQLLNLGTAVTVRWHAGNWHWHAVNRQLPSTQQSIDPAINTALGATILVTLLSRFFQEIHASSVIGCHPTGAIATGSIDTATTVYNLY